MVHEPELVQNDPWLRPFALKIQERLSRSRKAETLLLHGGQTLKDFAVGHFYFGLHKTTTGWILREWAPNASSIHLIGTFNGWKVIDAYAFKSTNAGEWELNLPPEALKHGDLYKLLIHWKGGSGERIPAWARKLVQDDTTKIFSAQVWDPPVTHAWKHPFIRQKNKPLLIYEAHIGMATEEYRVGTYSEFRLNTLPRIIKNGYNAIQLMAIQEHPYYGSFGYHVSSFFAPSSRFGTPEELKELIDAAHAAGVAVIMDLVHSHAVKNEAEGIGNYDGSPGMFFHTGPRRDHQAWDSLCFNYHKPEVIHFLLSNCAYWLGEFHFDGFRFDGITSMLYLDHGLGRDFTGYNMYFDDQEDEDAIVYLMLANKLIHELYPQAITIAEDMSGMPGLAAPQVSGGYGFDFRLAMGTPDYWIKIIKELPDEKWNVNELYHELTNRRADEKTINYVESHDQALVGDQTVIFRLIGKHMYDCMAKTSQSLVVDRGLALHRMIRLITAATAGSGYLNFMGNEFGHPEWIDFPREGNNWSYHYARRQWSIADDPLLRYHWLGEFDQDMIALISSSNLYLQPFPVWTYGSEPDQVLAFERENYLFVFNFHPSRSYTDYGVKVNPGKYRIVLNTDDFKYGGFGRIDQSLIFYAQVLGKLSSTGDNYLKLYLPCRTAIVFNKIATRKLY
ncbi:MAG: alpha amylase C-terminal domain-containing protein [Bacteroidales bacterium]